MTEPAPAEDKVAEAPAAAAESTVVEDTAGKFVALLLCCVQYLSSYNTFLLNVCC
jgi:hypothetical protein